MNYILSFDGVDSFNLPLLHFVTSKVFYSFGDEATNDFSAEFTLFVPPLAGTQPPNRPTTVILYDDMGRGSTGKW